MSTDQAQIVFSTLADEIYRTPSCIAPENRKQNRIELISKLCKHIGVQLLNCGAIDAEYYIAVCGAL